MRNAALLACLLVPAWGSACSGSPKDGLVVGGLYSVKQSGKFRIVKVLVLDADVVHLRVYKGVHTSRPTHVDASKLEVGKFTEKDAGMGHMPLDRKKFNGGWEPHLITKAAVAESELDGYREWQKSGGGVF